MLYEVVIQVINYIIIFHHEDLESVQTKSHYDNGIIPLCYQEILPIYVHKPVTIFAKCLLYKNLVVCS